MEIEKKVDNLTIAYHEAMDILCSTLFTDPYFDVKFHGYGFCGLGLPVGTLALGAPNSGEDDNQSDFFGYLSNYGSFAHHVLKNSVALESKSYGFDPRYLNQWKVVFYINNTPRADTVELTLTSRTFCTLQETYEVIGLSEAVRISQLNDGTAKFSFNGNIADKKLNSFVRNVPIIRPKALVGIEIQPNNNVKVKPCKYEHLGECIQGIKNKVAVYCPEWPRQAYAWISRTKPNKWPPKKLIENITREGIILVPVQSEYGKPSTEKGQWVYSFWNAEKQLLKSFDESQKNLYKLLLGFETPLEQLCCVNNSILHQVFLHSLFWFFEQHPPEYNLSEDLDNSEVIVLFTTYLLQIIKKRKLSHYFLSEIDIFSDISITLVEKLQETLEYMIESKEFLSDIISDTSFSAVVDVYMKALDEAHRETFKQNIVSKVTENLVFSFEGMIKVAYHTLFAKLHQREHMDSSIELHQSIIQAMKEMSCDMTEVTNIKDWCIRLVTNSLGSLYLAKAQVSQETQTKKGFFSKCIRRVPTSETYFYIQKAEEYLLTTNNIDLMAGKVKLANFYFMNHQFQECQELIQEIFHVTAQLQPSKYNSAQIAKMEVASDVSAVFFLRNLIERNIILDMLFSKIDKNTLAPFLNKSVELTVDQIGTQPTKVFVLDADIYAHFLCAMSYFHLGEVPKAVVQLCKLQNLWNKSQSDANERRNIAYLNAIGTCYLEVGEREKAIDVFEQSKKKFTNVRTNPATFKLLALKTEKTREIAKTTVSVAVGVAVAATVIGIVRSKLM